MKSEKYYKYYKFQNSTCIRHSINLEYFLPAFPPGPYSHEDSSKTSLPTRMPYLAITILSPL